ncbi:MULTISPECIES: LysR family transcriptional regulator [unclassified Pseudodesulfovibrio]|uniref:winged helix-turn-helix domain-containing protein n=1 Tax=unclassified Pseudodesulfovibrio TaxID=2661612 RepID=UPI000FEBDE43|nr:MULTISPECIES: LysR family transcriptional regulator [unclassified Pseudodesulfovibrio]MCJ2163710.1 LysR family transcriptional regulator [Pseudodesulfovibrio sp. S3-i]RWU06034.1 LysR family transcriptional regulator [Pseudodesulfovibrio sp. S3]
MSNTNALEKGSVSQVGPTMRMHLWFETNQGVLFGLGRLQLLQKVERCGSLKAAAESLGMSYRGAWGKIKTTEELIGQKLIERADNRRAGYHLTPFGLVIAQSYDRWYQEVESYALSKSHELLPFSLEPYDGEM